MCSIMEVLGAAADKKVTVYVDTYINQPYMLINRVRNESVYISTEEDRLTIKAVDKYKTHIVNIKMELIQNVQKVSCSDEIVTVVFELRGTGIKFKITVEQ